MNLRIAQVAAALAAAAASAWLAARAPLGLDYPHDGGPAVRALVEGRIGDFMAAQPLMGSFSVLLRAPFAALVGGGELAAYRAGAFPCLLAAGLVGVALAAGMARRGQPTVAWVAVGGLALLTPATFAALRLGHPEELLGAALCVGAVLAAGGRRVGLAGVLLGLALATKQWALLAVLPVLLAAPEGRVRLALVAGALAAALTLPFVAAHPGDFASTQVEAASTPAELGPASAWFPIYSTREQVVFDGVEDRTVTDYILPGILGRIPHPLIVLLALPLGWLAWRRGRVGLEAGLGLLALLFLLRCVLDPVNNEYYHVPFLLALLAWEARRGGLPLRTGLAATLLFLTFERVADPGRNTETFAVYLAWTVPFVAHLAWALYGPAGRPAPAAPEGRRQPLAGASGA